MVLVLMRSKQSRWDLLNTRCNCLRRRLVLANRPQDSHLNERAHLTCASVASVRDPNHSAAVREAIAPDALAAELKSFGASVWTAKSVNVLKHVWSARGDAVCSAVKGLAADVLNIGKVRPLAPP